jgi:hypothetical protein
MRRSQEMSNPTGGLEKHAQTAIQVILVAITVWVGSSIIALRDASIRAEEKNSTMRETIVELKTEIASLRTVVANGAERDQQAAQTIRDIVGRVQQNQARIDKLELRLLRRSPGPENP